MLTTDEIRDELSFDERALGMEAAAFDDLLDRLLDREQSRVEDAIDVAIGTETVTETLSRPSSVAREDLPLPDRPIQSVASIEIADHVGGADVSVDDVFVEGAYLELKPEADRNSWPTRRRSITVEYTHGYADTDVPDPVRGAIIGLVRHALQEIESDGVENESIDGQSVTYELGDEVVSRHLHRAKRFNQPSYYGGSQTV